jgi:hypothetical protein
MTPQVRYERIQQLKAAVNDPPLSEDQKATMETPELRTDSARRVAIERGATEAVDRGKCREIPVTCILCARGRIDCNGVYEITVGAQAANMLLSEPPQERFYLAQI